LALAAFSLRVFRGAIPFGGKIQKWENCVPGKSCGDLQLPLFFLCAVLFWHIRGFEIPNNNG
jgi:hypothetical protein